MSFNGREYVVQNFLSDPRLRTLPWWRINFNEVCRLAVVVTHIHMGRFMEALARSATAINSIHGLVVLSLFDTPHQIKKIEEL